MIDYSAILHRRYTGKQWILNGDDYDGLTWLAKTKKPSQEELDQLWPEVQQEIANEKQARENARNSALAKLGLTADEISALFG